MAYPQPPFTDSTTMYDHPTLLQHPPPNNWAIYLPQDDSHNQNQNPHQLQPHQQHPPLPLPYYHPIDPNTQPYMYTYDPSPHFGPSIPMPMPMSLPTPSSSIFTQSTLPTPLLEGNFQTLHPPPAPPSPTESTCSNFSTQPQQAKSKAKAKGKGRAKPKPKPKNRSHTHNRSTSSFSTGPLNPTHGNHSSITHPLPLPHPPSHSQIHPPNHAKPNSNPSISILLKNIGPLLPAPPGTTLEVENLLILHPPSILTPHSKSKLPYNQYTKQHYNQGGDEKGVSGGKGVGGKGMGVGGGPGMVVGKSQFEMYTCRVCSKTYDGKNARSVARRHLQDKHGVPLSAQGRRSRWDDEPTRPKDQYEAKERNKRSKRGWAVKTRTINRLEKTHADYLLNFGPSGLHITLPNPLLDPTHPINSTTTNTHPNQDIPTTTTITLIAPECRTANYQGGVYYDGWNVRVEDLPIGLIEGLREYMEIERRLEGGERGVSAFGGIGGIGGFGGVGGVGGFHNMDMGPGASVGMGGSSTMLYGGQGDGNAFDFDWEDAEGEIDESFGEKVVIEVVKEMPRKRATAKGRGKANAKKGGKGKEKEIVEAGGEVYESPSTNMFEERGGGLVNRTPVSDTRSSGEGVEKVGMGSWAGAGAGSALQDVVGLSGGVEKVTNGFGGHLGSRYVNESREDRRLDREETPSSSDEDEDVEINQPQMVQQWVQPTPTDVEWYIRQTQPVIDMAVEGYEDDQEHLERLFAPVEMVDELDLGQEEAANSLLNLQSTPVRPEDEDEAGDRVRSGREMYGGGGENGIEGPQDRYERVSSGVNQQSGQYLSNAISTHSTLSHQPQSLLQPPDIITSNLVPRPRPARARSFIKPFVRGRPEALSRSLSFSQAVPEMGGDEDDVFGFTSGVLDLDSPSGGREGKKRKGGARGGVSPSPLGGKKARGEGHSGVRFQRDEGEEKGDAGVGGGGGVGGVGGGIREGLRSARKVLGDVGANVNSQFVTPVRPGASRKGFGSEALGLPINLGGGGGGVGISGSVSGSTRKVGRESVRRGVGGLMSGKRGRDGGFSLGGAMGAGGGGGEGGLDSSPGNVERAEMLGLGLGGFWVMGTPGLGGVGVDTPRRG